MQTPVSKKLRIKDNDILFTINAPADFKKSMGTLPAGVKITSSSAKYNQVHWFVKNRMEMEKALNKVLKLLKEDVVLWIYYPKGTSKIQTDLSRDKGWEALMKQEDKFTWNSLISFDETWSTFGCRIKTDADNKKKARQPASRPIFDYVDPVTKTVKLPDDLAKVFSKNKSQAAIFNSLSFTNRKEYVEWIITAKKEETRKARVEGTMDKLSKGWKNPSGN